MASPEPRNWSMTAVKNTSVNESDDLVAERCRLLSAPLVIRLHDIGNIFRFSPSDHNNVAQQIHTIECNVANLKKETENHSPQSFQEGGVIELRKDFKFMLERIYKIPQPSSDVKCRQSRHETKPVAATCGA